jgi:DNA-binding HxlR family transcriptional regulator
MIRDPADGPVACAAPNGLSRAVGLHPFGERWTFLILREAFLGATKFAEFRDRLGVAPDVLSDRLSTLVQYGVMERAPYQEPGARPRFAYRITPAGTELGPVSKGAGWAGCDLEMSRVGHRE